MPTSAEYAKGLQWNRDVNLWAKSLEVNAIALLEVFLDSLVEQTAPLIEQWMKENAHWIDRTGNARRGLHVEIETLIHEAYEIVLDHGDDVEYGVWLELKNQGRYAIIQPALDYWYPIIIQAVRDFLKGLK